MAKYGQLKAFLKQSIEASTYHENNEWVFHLVCLLSQCIYNQKLLHDHYNCDVPGENRPTGASLIIE